MLQGNPPCLPSLRFLTLKSCNENKYNCILVMLVLVAYWPPKRIVARTAYWFLGADGAKTEIHKILKSIVHPGIHRESRNPSWIQKFMVKPGSHSESWNPPWIQESIVNPEIRFDLFTIYVYPIGFVIPSRVTILQNIKYLDISDDLNGGQ